MIQSLVDNWLGWLGLGATAATVISLLSWVPGVGVALRIGASLLEIASPVINGVLAAIVWVWSYILFPGLRGIFSSVSISLTVVALFVGYYLFDKTNDTINYRNLQRLNNSCIDSIRNKTPLQPVDQEPLVKIFPWNW